MTSVIVDSRISSASERRLCALGFYPIKLPPFSGLPEAICSHPDSLMTRIGDNIITFAQLCDAAPYVFTDLRERHPNISIFFTDDTPDGRYPEDCKFNALTLSGKLYARLDSLSPSIIKQAEAMGYTSVNTRQGYPACATLALHGADGRGYAITSDRGLALTLEKHGVDTTLIGTDGISLPPYEYGFIGGACGVYRNKVYFFGDVERHPDAKVILATLARVGYEAVSLSDEELCDLGGMIFID